MIRFDGRVVIVTGGGAGLGRSHALAFARRGAKVLVNDFGCTAIGSNPSEGTASSVVSEIQADGGEATANHDSVEQVERLVEAAMDAWGRVDIVINNAGNLRNRAFANMSKDDWEAVNRVHLLGAYKVTRAAWPVMQSAAYGRIINTSSAALYGNFGQANYSATKAGLWGFTRTLAIEGARYGILVNAVAPLADLRLLRTIMPAGQAARLKPEAVSALVLKLCSEEHRDTGELFEAGGGWFAQVRFQRAQGLILDANAEDPDLLAASWSQVGDFSTSTYPADAQQSIVSVLK